MQIPTWHYNDLQQVGVDFEDPAEVAAFDRNQTSSTVAAERSLVAQLGISRGHDDFETHVREEYSTFTWIIEGMLDRVGFEVESNYLSPTIAEYICRKR